MNYYKSFSNRKKRPGPSLPKPIRIEKQMIHGQLVEVKIYAQVGTSTEGPDVRAKATRSRSSRCSG